MVVWIYNTFYNLRVKIDLQNIFEREFLIMLKNIPC